MEVEDDSFFADLSKQISLLIMDDDEEDPVANCPSVSLQVLSSSFCDIQTLVFSCAISNLVYFFFQLIWLLNECG